MDKSLKLFNGRGWDVGHIYIAAKTKKDAARLYCEAHKKARNATWEIDKSDIGRAYREISVYFSPCWGNPMDGITPEVGVWWQEDFRDKPIRVI